MIETLPRCVESALAQTEENFELLIIDDGSSDGTWEYLTRVSALDRRIRLFRNKLNCGLTQSRNRLLAEATAAFYSILDADDVLEPHKLQRHCKLLADHPEVGVVWGSARVYWGNGAKEPELLPRNPTAALTNESWDLTTPFEVVHSATTWRRDAVLKLGGYDPKYVLIEGPELFFRIGDKNTQYFDPALACTKYVNPQNSFRQELNLEKRGELSREILLNTLRRRHRVFLDKKPAWAGPG